MEYYSLIIIEDEEDIRNGLVNVVDWDKLGYKITGVFNNAKRAIDFLINNDVDLIITDIIMPNLSGLDFAKWIKDNKPNIKIVLLSAYNDFSYAQQAIKLNVKYYLLKPTNIDELNDTLSHIRDQLDNETQYYKKQRDLKKKQERIMLFSQQAMFNKLFSEKVTDEALLQLFLEIVGFDGDFSNYGWWFCILLIGTQPSVSLNKPYSFSLKDSEVIFNALNSGNKSFSAVPIFYGQERIYAVIWSRSTQDSDEFSINCTNENIKQNVAILKNLLGLNLTLESLQFYQSLVEMIASVDSTAIKNNVNVLNPVSDIQRVDEENNQLILKMKGSLDRNDLQSIMDYIKSLNKDYDPISFSYIQKYAIALALELRIHYLKNEEAIPYTLNDEGIYQNIVLVEKIQSLIDYCDLILNEYNKHKIIIEKFTIRKIKEYIHVHIFENISISKIAQQVYLNPSYLSRMFKKETKESISEYILKKKMDKAKELLMDPKYKVYQVGEMIGYKDVRHFYSIFRRFNKLTPQEYRNNIDLLQ